VDAPRRFPVFVRVAGLAVLATLSAVGGCRRKAADAPPPVAATNPDAVWAPNDTPPPDAPTLAGAIAFARPKMTETPGGVSAGTLILIGWSARHPHWADVDVPKNETSYELAQTDLEHQKGKRMCVSGTIASIGPVRTDSAHYWNGVLNVGGGKQIAFFGVGGLGTLQGGSKARFCGVVTDAVGNAEQMAHHRRAVVMVGMLDVAENRALDNPAE
jgi:hypothetical protein